MSRSQFASELDSTTVLQRTYSGDHIPTCTWLVSRVNNSTTEPVRSIVLYRHEKAWDDTCNLLETLQVRTS